jgi:hypothetical protein
MTIIGQNILCTEERAQQITIYIIVYMEFMFLYISEQNLKEPTYLINMSAYHCTARCSLIQYFTPISKWLSLATMDNETSLLSDVLHHHESINSKQGRMRKPNLPARLQEQKLLILSPNPL